MRNLRILRDNALNLGEGLGSPITASTWDTQSDAIIFAVGPTAISPTIEVRRASTLAVDITDTPSLIAAWDAPCPLPDLDYDRIVDLHYFAETGVICLVLAGGDVVNVHSDPSSPVKIEIVGSVDGGIHAAKWSPDEELLAISTRLNTVLFMTADFDCLASVELSDNDAKLSKHVSVGWGKSETQFKGKRAKAMRDPTMPEKIEQGTLSPFDRREVTISWRGDGAFVAVNSIIEEGPRRMIRIFDRQGVLDGVSEPVDGLEGSLSWRPAGNIIASVQRLESGEANVVFFERNGLRHGGFPLRLSLKNSERWKANIALAWNPLSTVLAVSYQDVVQLWTMSNYHYYLKQQITLWGEINTTAVPVTWHPEDSMRMSLSWNNASASIPPADVESVPPPLGILRDIQVGFTVASGSTIAPNDLGIVAVIDGEYLKYTPLKQANVPPPMFLHEFQLPCCKDVAIGDKNRYIAVLHEDSVTLIQIDATLQSSDAKHMETKQIRKLQTQYTLQVCNQGEDFYVLLLDKTSMNLSLYDVHAEKTFSIAGTREGLHHLTCSIDGGSLCLLTSNTAYRLRGGFSRDRGGDGETIEGDPLCRFGTGATISKLEIAHPKATGGSSDSSVSEEVIRTDFSTVICFALSANGTLYANTRQLLRNCSGFITTQDYLIVTTTNHLLKFIHLTEFEDLEVPPDDGEEDERCRNIERGARLVTVMPSSVSLVLQMPRGNLETIHPRVLVLANIRRNLDSKQYLKAFSMCRTQRVDMNIIHDYSPRQFLDNVEQFVAQVKRVEDIDLFLSQLRNEDVTQTMYQETLLPKVRRGEAASMAILNGVQNGEINKSPEHLSPEPKVNRICDAFLSVLQSKYSTHLQNVITANVCKIPPNIEAGLQVAARLREQEPELADEAVEHICFLVDVNRVYEAALGLYDLDLALLVAQQSQKDPREYLPYLQNLRSLAPLRTKFTIDNDLHRFRKALEHLQEMKEFEEFQSYMQKHELYREALELYRYDQEATRALTVLYADYLNDRHHYKEAGIAYESLNDFAAASAAYRADGLWEQSLSTATMVPLPADELKAIASSLADQLFNTKDFHSSACIHLEYLNDLETSLSHFCKAHQFSTAIRITALRSRPDLITRIIDPGLIEASGTLTELLADCKSQLKAQVPRLSELRKAKAANPLAFFGGEGEASGNADIPDDISIAPSATSTTGGASLFTRYTQRSGLTNTVATGTSRKTSKNRRREERKRARGKKGSVYEEEYLVNSVGRLIERVNDTAGDVTRTVEGLLRRNMKERARAVEEAMEELVGLCSECVAEVYEVPKDQQSLTGNANEEDGGENERPPGADGVLWDSMEQAKAARVVPVVKPYQRSGLSY